jgi:hypothetical protein
MHLPEGASAEEPVEEPASGVPKWLFEGLSLAGAETIERDCKVVDTND